LVEADNAELDAVVDGGGGTWTVPYQLGTELGGTSRSPYGFVTVTP